MATVNRYFQSGRSIGRTSEQSLYEDLIIESMKIYGFEVYYLPRSISNLDSVLTEDPLNYYNHAFAIEMYLEDTQGFTGDSELLTKFGLEIRDTANLVVARKRWKDIIGSSGTTVLPERPAEGDIIYFPLTKSFFEIRKVEGQQPFYQVGKLYTFKMSCELMQLSNERFNTGISEIDDLIKDLSLNVINYEMTNEQGDSLLLETNALTPLVSEDFTIDPQVGADNVEYDKNITDVLDFSETNPFGEPYQ